MWYIVLVIASVIMTFISAYVLSWAWISQTKKDDTEIITQTQRYFGTVCAAILAIVPLVLVLSIYGFPQSWFATIICIQIILITGAALAVINIYWNPSYLAKSVTIKVREGTRYEKNETGYVTTEDVRSRSRPWWVLKPEPPYSYYGKRMRQYETIGKY